MAIFLYWRVWECPMQSCGMWFLEKHRRRNTAIIAMQFQEEEATIFFSIAASLFAAWLYPHPAEYQNWTWLLAVLALAIPFQYITDNVLCNERAMFANQRYAVMSLLLSFSIIMTKIISGRAGGITGVIFCQTGLYVVLAGVYYFNSKRQVLCWVPKNPPIKRKEKRNKPLCIPIYDNEWIVGNFYAERYLPFGKTWRKPGDTGGL